MAGEKLQFAGTLSKPKGNGPFPAVVMLCRRGGLKDEGDAKQQNTWAERPMSWGYVFLLLDIFGPHNYDKICGKTSVVNDLIRSLDAYSAKSYRQYVQFREKSQQKGDCFSSVEAFENILWESETFSQVVMWIMVKLKS